MNRRSFWTLMASLPFCFGARKSIAESVNVAPSLEDVLRKSRWVLPIVNNDGDLLLDITIRGDVPVKVFPAECTSRKLRFFIVLRGRVYPLDTTDPDCLAKAKARFG